MFFAAVIDRVSFEQTVDPIRRECEALDKEVVNEDDVEAGMGTRGGGVNDVIPSRSLFMELEV